MNTVWEHSGSAPCSRILRQDINVLSKSYFKIYSEVSLRVMKKMMNMQSKVVWFFFFSLVKSAACQPLTGDLTASDLHPNPVSRNIILNLTHRLIKLKYSPFAGEKLHQIYFSLEFRAIPSILSTIFLLDWLQSSTWAACSKRTPIFQWRAVTFTDRQHRGNLCVMDSHVVWRNDHFWYIKSLQIMFLICNWEKKILTVPTVTGKKAANI